MEQHRSILQAEGAQMINPLGLGESESFHVCLSLASLDPRTGGTARTVPALAANLQPGLISPHLLSYDGYQDGCHQSVFFGKKNIIRFFRENKISLVHDNGIWHPFNHMVSVCCDKSNLPRIISPHGMLEPWALQYKKWKKQIAWHLYQKKDMKTAVCFHATARSEAENIRKLGFTRPIAVIPNGVDFPKKMPRRQHDDATGVKKALFLSRIHPKKGLKDLVNAWKRLNPEKWELCIAGPDEGGHENEIRLLVKKLGLSSQVHFLGNLSDNDKWEVYRSSDLFVLPTYSENFGIVVAEALAAEIPVITTTGTPWKDLEEEKCGWWIPPGEQSLFSTLRQVLQIPDQELNKMGKRGKKMVLERYDWQNVAQSMADVYRWLMHKGSRPECIFE